MISAGLWYYCNTDHQNWDSTEVHKHKKLVEGGNAIASSNYLKTHEVFEKNMLNIMATSLQNLCIS